jgi:hypothetical protein
MKDEDEQAWAQQAAAAFKVEDLEIAKAPLAPGVAFVVLGKVSLYVMEDGRRLTTDEYMRGRLTLLDGGVA